MKNKKVRTFFFLALILICFSIKTYGFGERVDYIIGMDRYETSALLSEANYAKSPYAVIASGESYIDALTSSPLAFSKKAPILLTNKNKLNEFTKGEILRLGTKNVYIVGGNGAVSEGVEEEIKNLGIQVTRLGGINRYETSVKIAKELGDIENIIICSGNDYKDVTLISSYASMNKNPIILYDDDKSYLENYMNEKGINSGYIIGDLNLNYDIFSAFKKVDNKRTGDILKSFYGDIDVEALLLTTSSNFADALSSAPIAAMKKSPVIPLGQYAEKETINFVKNKGYFDVIVVGGTVSKDAVQAVVNRTYIPPEFTEENSKIKPLPDKYEMVYLEQLEKELFNLCNKAREERGLTPLVWDEELYEISKYKSRAMMQLEYFGHNNINYDNRMAQALAEAFDYAPTSIKENILYTTKYLSEIDANHIFDLWMNSESHRENILYSKHTKTAISVAYSDKYYSKYKRNNILFATQHFSNK